MNGSPFRICSKELTLDFLPNDSVSGISESKLVLLSPCVMFPFWDVKSTFVTYFDLSLLNGHGRLMPQDVPLNFSRFNTL